ncbi:MAG: hypothetical protein ACYDCQ_18935 [Dehalococcoidia bacterium]
MAKGGYVVDAAARTVGGPGGDTYALDRVEVVQGRLFLARSIANNASIFYHESWIMPVQGWVITRWAFHEQLRATAIDWKMEPNQVEVDGPLWRVSDGFLDLDVYEGSRYDLDDADELADALAAGTISLAEGLVALHALNTLCKALRRHGYSGHSLLREYAPGLPA